MKNPEQVKLMPNQRNTTVPNVLRFGFLSSVLLVILGTRNAKDSVQKVSF
ncbi:unnamed protein product, partial [Calypogeia fissa]